MSIFAIFSIHNIPQHLSSVNCSSFSGLRTQPKWSKSCTICHKIEKYHQIESPYLTWKLSLAQGVILGLFLRPKAAWNTLILVDINVKIGGATWFIPRFFDIYACTCDAFEFPNDHCPGTCSTFQPILRISYVPYCICKQNHVF